MTVLIPFKHATQKQNHYTYKDNFLSHYEIASKLKEELIQYNLELYHPIKRQLLNLNPDFSVHKNNFGTPDALITKDKRVIYCEIKPEDNSFKEILEGVGQCLSYLTFEKESVLICSDRWKNEILIIMTYINNPKIFPIFFNAVTNNFDLTYFKDLVNEITVLPQRENNNLQQTKIELSPTTLLFNHLLKIKNERQKDIYNFPELWDSIPEDLKELCCIKTYRSLGQLLSKLKLKSKVSRNKNRKVEKVYNLNSKWMKEALG